ncbi:MAG: trans-sulfuration enzyme family protein [Bacteroidota bacterium]
MRYRLIKTGDATRAVHGTTYGAFQAPVVQPIVQSVTYRFANSSDALRYARGDESVYIYSRYRNPTTEHLKEAVAAVEDAEDAHIFSSGMAAITTTILALAPQGSEIISASALYGGTYRFFRDIAPNHGIRIHFFNPRNLDMLSRLLTKRTRLVYFETPTNPTLSIVDIKGVVLRVREAQKKLRKHIPIVLDNTFATVFNQRPLRLGVDLTVESATKYIGGHHDVLAGVVAGQKKLVSIISGYAKYLGGTPDPFASFLLLRSLKTLHLRIHQQNENAMELAKFLEGHPKVKRVFYPGLPSHPDHEIAKKQMSGFGGMVTIEISGGVRSAIRVVDSLQIAVNATSLGGVETLVSIPVLTSHIHMSRAELAQHGVTPGMIRISVGVEDVEDLKNDFARALRRA